MLHTNKSKANSVDSTEPSLMCFFTFEKKFQESSVFFITTQQ